MNITPLKLIFAVAALSIASAATADWHAHQEGDKWYIREGETRIPMPDEKTARKTAEKNNKAIRRGEKRTGDGVVDSGGLPCSDPRSGVRC